MTLTEEEAKTKWCPHVRSLNGANRLTPKEITKDEAYAGMAIGICIASQCMAWRWEQSPEVAARHAELKASGDLHKGAGDGIARGFCGLAGKPR